MRKTMAAGLLAWLIGAVLAGCGIARGQVLEPVPVQSRVFAVEYRQLADCAYLRFDAQEHDGLYRVDLSTSGMIKINRNPGSMRLWEITLTQAGPAETRVDVTVLGTLWGPSGDGASILATVAGCASP